MVGNKLLQFLLARDNANPALAVPIPLGLIKEFLEETNAAIAALSGGGGDMLAENNLADLTDKAAARANLSVSTLAITTTATNIVLTSANGTVEVDASGGNKTVTLPAANTVTKAIFTIKKIDSSANTVTIIGTIDGASNYVISDENAAIAIQSNGTAYKVIGGY